MTSTSTMQGLTDGKPSSKVLNPPGGRSNNIFGDYSEPVESKASKSDTAAISSVFPATTEEASQSAMKNKAKSQESSQFIYGGDLYQKYTCGYYTRKNRLFGGTDDDDKPSGKARDEDEATDADAAAALGDSEDAELKAVADSSEPSKAQSDEPETASTPSPRKGRGAYNPITGEDYEGTPSPKPTTPQGRVRQPPGGHSSGLW